MHYHFHRAASLAELPDKSNPNPKFACFKASLCDYRPENMIVTGSDDATVRVWNSDGTARWKPFEGHKKAVTCLAILPDHRHASPLS